MKIDCRSFCKKFSNNRKNENATIFFEVNMEVTISVPPKIEEILGRKAAEKGQNIKEFIETLVERQAVKPSLDEILAPMREDFAKSGMTEDDLDALIKSERRGMREEKEAK